nr:RNA-directed DNA polymerase, eukaryota, reverse transcriptase zinc-binding domain protein [Tanacetum cinerariifolium]
MNGDTQGQTERQNETTMVTAAVGRFDIWIWFFDADARLRSGLPRVCWIKQKEMYLVWRSSRIRVSSVYMVGYCLRDEQLKNHDTNLIGFIHKKIVKMSHENVRYSLRRIPWGGIKQVRFLEFLASMDGVALVEMRDRWVWSFEGSGEFFVASVRKLIVERWVPKVSIKTR